MKVNQVKPEYTKIVAAIPHSVSEAHFWQWQSKSPVKESLNRWTDWFTDELFGSEMSGVAVVKAKVSRFECDVERLGGEKDRLCRFVRERGDDDTREWVLGNAMCRNDYLADWYRYRAEILEAASADVTLIVDCHSFPSDLAPEVDVCLGFNDDASRPSQQTIEQVAQLFRDAGYSVAFNHPYSNALAPVGYIGHSMMIEVNKRTYMDEKTIEKSSGFDKLKNTIDAVYKALLWMHLNTPRNFSCPWDYPVNGSEEERKAAWESIKSSIIRFTADRYGVQEPEDQSDTDQVRILRKRLDCSWGSPSWTRSLAWLTLANAMLASVFKRIDVTLPSDAFVQHYMHRAAMPKAWRERFREMI